LVPDAEGPLGVAAGFEVAVEIGVAAVPAPGRNETLGVSVPVSAPAVLPTLGAVAVGATVAAPHPPRAVVVSAVSDICSSSDSRL
jgi:hypothetical protein